LRESIVVAAEQHALDIRTQLLGNHQRAKSHPGALIDHRVARHRTLADVPQRDPQIIGSIEQDRQARHHDRGRIAAARRKIERQRFRMFGIGEGMKRSFDFVARRSRVILRPGRQIGGTATLKGEKQNESDKHNPRGH
jgi:hypothetical protein